VAIATYRTVARTYFDELSPSLSALRHHLLLELGAHGQAAALTTLLGGVPTWATERALALAAAGRALVAGDRGPFAALLAGPMGTLAPSWDVATPSYHEAPAALEAAARAAATQPRDALPSSHARAAASARAALDRLCSDLPRGAATRLRRRVALAREAVRLGELDDGLFARAQAVVRRALLAGAPERLRPAADDARRAALVPPLRIEGTARLYPRPPRHGALRGSGGGGRARGPAFILSDASVTPPPGVVLVVATVLPAFAHLLAHAVALVTDHGGLLSHGAALARELGLPMVVNTGMATRSFHSGQALVVDGDSGWVFPAPAP